MTISIAHLGPAGTNAETAAVAFTNKLSQLGQKSFLCPYPSIAQTLWAVSQGEVNLAVVPVENSIEGSVTVTLDTLWQLDSLEIQTALVLPISHGLISLADSFEEIKTVYSHPQALAQCQGWLEKFLPQIQQIPDNSTTEALQHLGKDRSAAAIASQRAALLYKLPILAYPINDYPDNCTRFWVLKEGCTEIENSDLKLIINRINQPENSIFISLGFSVPANVPGALVKPLEVFAKRGINMSRIESRPTKRSLGDYLFFIDIEVKNNDDFIEVAIEELKTYTETLKIFGSYTIMALN
ncbi:MULTISPECIES: prephenate dehydratase [Okeania]|uniref:Prephenate dehydratase n=1 Tax=Okeania hirsuta TaxID=1458930 RepID=A0A3N6P0C8_9CYAN|nr:MULTISPECIES: prephenate dehydratase [Okeania]NES77572.1 prephenate dehydratase [Okeania sp. SIO1H4]NES90355.1 prephenate dehydratase [Okeania sp. SIO2B9]NET21198.1 prephenate dehydratase [Okeania sp. SIO1H5]NET77939.1 prephenate dehydratase [Okeania sp. SIO1F9]NET95245.1 prephenate dehydratase [Okeania sp. SIO1H2]